MLVVLNTINTYCGVVGVTTLVDSKGHFFDDLLVGFNDTVRDRGNNNLETFQPFFILFLHLVGSNGHDKFVQKSSDNFEGKDDNDGKDVEAIVNGGTSKGLDEDVNSKEISSTNHIETQNK